MEPDNSPAEQQGLWVRLEARAKKTRPSAQDIWVTVKERLDFSKLKPKGVSSIEVGKQRFSGGEEYFVLHNTEKDFYLQLDDRGFFLWNLMDGKHSLTDISVAYLQKFGSLPFEQLRGLLAQLKSNYFLEEKNPNLYELIGNRFSAKGLKWRVARLWKKVAQAQVSINADGYFNWVYHHGGWLFFTSPAKIIYLILSGVGIVLFLWQLIGGNYHIFKIADSYGLGILTLLLLNNAILIIHEHGHGLTVKSYGRKVVSGGFMLYWGNPCMYVDTTDMWLGSRKQRIVVSWAGPYTGWIIGSVCSIIIAFLPSSALAPVLFQMAFLGMFNVLTNMNPLLEWDGYYILMNYLEIPRLRAKSLDFIKGPLWQKLFRGKSKFNREEKIFTVFGIMSAIWTVVAIMLVVHVWQRYLYGMFKSMWASEWIGSKVILIIIGVVAVVLVGSSIGLKIWKALQDVGKAIARRGKSDVRA